MIDPWIDKARGPLHFGMLIEDRAPLAVISDFVPDNHHSHLILHLLSSNSMVNCGMEDIRVIDSSTTIPCHSPSAEQTSGRSDRAGRAPGARQYRRPEDLSRSQA